MRAGKRYKGGTLGWGEVDGRWAAMEWEVGLRLSTCARSNFLGSLWLGNWVDQWL